MPEPGTENLPPPIDQRKLAAVMFTDIVGYSRMMHQDEAATLKFLAEHNAVLEEQVKGHGGRVIKTIGDSLMVDFPSVVDAVYCAVAIQGLLHQLNKGRKPQDQRFIRIGIHLGDVVITGNDLFGEGVNIAARLEPLSPYGGICVSREVVAHLKGMKNIRVIRRGVQALKNISHPVEIFHLWAPNMDPTAGQRIQWARYKREIWALGGLMAALLILLIALPRIREWQDFKDWESWTREDFQDLSGFSQRWQTGGEPLGEAGLEGGSMTLKKPLPVQAFRLRVAYHVLPGSPVDISLSALGAGGGNGLFVRHSADPRLKWVKDQLGDRHEDEVKDEALRAGESGGNGQDRWLMLTYDGSRLAEESSRQGLWNALFPAGPVLSTWVRHAPASGFFRFFVKGRGVRLKNVEIYFRKPAGEKDVLTRANDAALDGRTDTALELFGELFKLATLPPDQCGFLYRQALVHRSAGEMTEAVNSYQRILADYPENLYSGYARLDLGVMEMEAAEKASHAKDRDHHAAKARGYLGGLLKRQKDHPEALRASYLLSVAALEEHDRPKAAKEALALIPSENPYAEPAFSVWLKALKGFGKKVDPAWPEQAIPELEALFHQKKLKGPLREKAAVALAEALRLMGKTPELSALATQACEPGGYSLPGREAIVAQWIAAEDKGLPLEASQELFGRFGKNSEEGLIFARAYLRGAGTKLADPVQAALWKAVKLDTKTAGPQDLKRREFMDWARGRFKLQGGAAGASVSPREEGGIIFNYRSGSETEQHLVIGPGVGPFSYEGAGDLPGQAVDVRLFKKVSFKAKCPKRKHFSLCLAELGTGDPAIRYAKGPGGSDGEEYEVGSWTGTGQWQHYELRLKDAKPDLDWGNQEGDLKVALGALGAVVLVVPTGEGSGIVEFKDLVFER